MLSVSRKFKKHNNPISWNKTAEIAGISQIGDGFDLVMISHFTCSDTIHTDYIYSNLNKACHFEGVSKQLVTLSFDYVNMFHNEKYNRLILYSYI